MDRTLEIKSKHHPTKVMDLLHKIRNMKLENKDIYKIFPYEHSVFSGTLSENTGFRSRTTFKFLSVIPGFSGTMTYLFLHSYAKSKRETLH